MLLVREHAEREDALLRSAPEHFAGDAHTARHRQRHVEDHDVGLGMFHEGICRLGLVRFAHEVQIGLRGEERPEPLPEQPVIVDDDELHGHPLYRTLRK